MRHDKIKEIFLKDTTIYLEPLRGEVDWDDCGYSKIDFRFFPEMPKTLCALHEIDYRLHPSIEECLYAFTFCTKSDIDLISRSQTLRKHYKYDEDDDDDKIFEIGMMWEENFVTAAKEYLKKIELEEATANMGVASKPSRRM